MYGFEEIHEETVRTEPDGTVVRTHRRTVRGLTPEEIRTMAEARVPRPAPGIFDVFRPSREPVPTPDGGIAAIFQHVRPSRT